ITDTAVPGGTISEAGLRLNVDVSLQYINAWLMGNGAAAIYNLMEDAATAEISRAQIWQWLHHPDARLDDGRAITPELYRSMVPEELDKIKSLLGESQYNEGRFPEAVEILNDLVLRDEFVDFLTLPAYAHLD
ncbi:MAG: malate synthase A, partial [Verrucomicrobiae bacterium]|nr:malate synthase A [Verrucomicrobiae bacterium]